MLQTVSLHKAEVQPGQQMLVGFAVKDANQDHRLSLRGWSNYPNLSRVPAGLMTDGCKRFTSMKIGKDFTLDKVPATDRPHFPECVLHFGGMGNRGRI